MESNPSPCYSVDIKPTAITQSQRDKYCMSPLTWGISSSTVLSNRVENGGHPFLGERGQGFNLMGVEFSIYKMGRFRSCLHNKVNVGNPTELWTYSLDGEFHVMHNFHSLTEIMTTPNVGEDGEKRDVSTHCW